MVDIIGPALRRAGIKYVDCECSWSGSSSDTDASSRPRQHEDVRPFGKVKRDPADVCADSDERNKSIDDLKSNPAITVILLSFKCGSVGLNLTCCSNVVLMGGWLRLRSVSRLMCYARKISGGTQH